jgi:formate-dependent nitrite reductase membrane component NrfD
VCPTECRIFGDLDDPSSEVARIVARESIAVRKPEKGTLPKVFYIAAEETAIQPEASTRPFIYKEGQVLLRPPGAPAPDPQRPGEPRVDYDTPHARPWGTDMVAYLLTKGIATGAMLVCAMLFLMGGSSPLTRIIGPSISLAFLIATAVVLIADLDRPERFYLILTRPNWRSWMVWGAYFLTAQGALTSAWILAGAVNSRAFLNALVVPVIVSSLLTTCYTGFLFAQARARDFWQGPHATIDLVPLAIAEGAAVLLLAGLIPRSGGAAGAEKILAFALAAHAVLLVIETLLTPSPTRHRRLAVAAVRTGAFARVFCCGAVETTIEVM